MYKKIKNIYDRFREFIKTKPKLLPIYVLIAVIIIASIAASYGFRNSRGRQVSDKVNKLAVQKDEIPEITTLAQDYYAALTAHDVDKMKGLVDNPDSVTESTLVKSAAVSYNNISTYTVEGLHKNEYVVFVYWEAKFSNADTMAPGLDSFYMVKDDSGKYLVHFGLSDEMKNYMNNLTKNDEIKKLFKDTNTKLNNAFKSDSKLKSVYEILQKKAEAQTSETKDTETQTETKN